MTSANLIASCQGHIFDEKNYLWLDKAKIFNHSCFSSCEALSFEPIANRIFSTTGHYTENDRHGFKRYEENLRPFEMWWVTDSRSYHG